MIQRVHVMKSKIDIFKSIFHGRRDIIPKFWQSKSGRCGYSPLCRNEWKKGICNKPCRACPSADYVPLTDELILKHFKGSHVLGVYPLLEDNTCNFIAADFDDHAGDRNPLEDVKAFVEVCEVQDIPCYVLRSKSGKGFHVYVFFSSPVPAWKARLVVFALLQEAGVAGEDAELSSFDRLFPNQDELTGKGIGNLIALPFQGQAARQGHTLFLDPHINFSAPYNNQWDVLFNIKKIDESILDDLIKDWNLKRKHRKVNNIGKNPEGWLIDAMRGVPEGERDTTGAKIAGFFVDKISKQNILGVMLGWNLNNKPPLDEPTVHKIVDSVYRYKSGEPKNAECKRIGISFNGT